jgi:hypothetical protein
VIPMLGGDSMEGGESGVRSRSTQWPHREEAEAAGRVEKAEGRMDRALGRSCSTLSSDPATMGV